MITQIYKKLYQRHKGLMLMLNHIAVVWLYTGIFQLFEGEMDWWRICGLITMFAIWMLLLAYTIDELVE